MEIIPIRARSYKARRCSRFQVRTNELLAPLGTCLGVRAVRC